MIEWSASWIIIDNKTKEKKLRNAFNNNISTDLKLSKAEISKLIQSGGFLGSLLSKLAGPLMNVMMHGWLSFRQTHVSLYPTFRMLYYTHFQGTALQ